MTLYVCKAKTGFASFGHPCDKAAVALDKAGYSYDLKVVGGFRSIWPWNLSAKRVEVKQLSGQEYVPILILDNGEVISGSGEIVDMAL